MGSMTLTQLRTDMNQINQQLLAIGKTEEVEDKKESIVHVVEEAKPEELVVKM